MDSALNNLKWLICYKTKPNQIKSNLIKQYVEILTKNETH